MQRTQTNLEVDVEDIQPRRRLSLSDVGRTSQVTFRRLHVGDTTQRNICVDVENRTLYVGRTQVTLRRGTFNCTQGTTYCTQAARRWQYVEEQIPVRREQDSVRRLHVGGSTQRKTLVYVGDRKFYVDCTQVTVRRGTSNCTQGTGQFTQAARRWQYVEENFIVRR